MGYIPPPRSIGKTGEGRPFASDRQRISYWAVHGFVAIWLPVSRRLLPHAQSGGHPKSWALHGQATFVDQYHPAFRSPYRGANSLDPGSRGNETFDATLVRGRAALGRAARPGPIWKWTRASACPTPWARRPFPAPRPTRSARPSPMAGCSGCSSARPSIWAARRKTVEGAANQLGGSAHRRQSGPHRRQILRHRYFRHQQLCPRSARRFPQLGDGRCRAPSTMPPMPGATAMAGRRNGAFDDWTLRGGLFDLSRVPNTTELETRLRPVRTGERSGAPHQPVRAMTARSSCWASSIAAAWAAITMRWRWRQATGTPARHRAGAPLSLARRAARSMSSRGSATIWAFSCAPA